MTTARLASAALLFAIADPGCSFGQTTSPPEPVTRILAIGTVDRGVDLAAVRAIVPAEVKATVALYLAGKIDQWFSLRDRNGVVFILTGSDVPAASTMLEALPLGQAHLMHFDLIPIGPLEPLRFLEGAL